MIAVFQRRSEVKEERKLTTRRFGHEEETDDRDEDETSLKREGNPPSDRVRDGRKAVPGDLGSASPRKEKGEEK